MEQDELKALAAKIEAQINPNPEAIHKIAINLSYEGGNVLVDLTDTSTDAHGKKFGTDFVLKVLDIAAHTEQNITFSKHPDVVMMQGFAASPAVEVGP